MYTVYIIRKWQYFYMYLNNGSSYGLSYSYTKLAIGCSVTVENIKCIWASENGYMCCKRFAYEISIDRMEYKFYFGLMTLRTSGTEGFKNIKRWLFLKGKFLKEIILIQSLTRNFLKTSMHLLCVIDIKLWNLLDATLANAISIDNFNSNTCSYCTMSVYICHISTPA